MSPRSNQLVSGQLKNATLMTSKPELAIRSRDTGQQISWYGSGQLNIIWMSNSPVWKSDSLGTKSRRNWLWDYLGGRRLKQTRRNLVWNVIAWIGFNRTTDSNIIK